MSEAVFQSAFVRLITDDQFAERVRSAASPPEISGLTRREAAGLRLLALSPGLSVMRKLHLGFRLNKLLSSLPLTCRLLGQRRLAAETRMFWAKRPSASFYFLEEAYAFAEHLQARMGQGLKVAYLGDVLAYEMALLILKRPLAPGEQPPIVEVTFRCDPRALLAAIQSGGRPSRIERAHTRLMAWADERGEVHWTDTSALGI